MQIVIYNQTAGTLSYLSGTITVAASPASTTVTNVPNLLSLSFDGQFRSDIIATNITIGDGVNTFGNSDALNYLIKIIQGIGPQSDGVGNQITSTSVSGHQTLDTNATQTGTWNINNVSGTVSLPTGASTSALQTTGNTSLSTIATALTLGQGSTTSGQTGALTLGAVTSAAPSYTTAQTDPISMNLVGSLRTQDIIDIGSQYQDLSVTTSAVEAKGAATHLANRKVVIITPTNGTVYWGTSSAVTTTSGTPIYQSQMVSLAFSSNVTIYLIAASTVDVRVVEGS